MIHVSQPEVRYGSRLSLKYASSVLGRPSLASYLVSALSLSLLKLAIIYSQLEIPTQNKNLPKCTAGYETWIMHHASRITGATFYEIAVYGKSASNLVFYQVT